MNCIIVKLLIVSVLVIESLSSVSAQKRRAEKIISPRKSVAIIPCKMTLKESPKLRGFYLGQTVKEISKLIPNFENAYETDTDGGFGADRKETGEVGLDSTQFFYQRGSGRVEKREEFTDVDFSWEFLDNKLIFLSVQYQEYEPISINDFISQLENTVKLPLQSWKIKGKNNAELKCDGFEMTIWTGRMDSRPDYKSYPLVIMTDTNAELEMENRKREIRQKALDLKLQKLREKKEQEQKEMERRKILKP